MNALYLQFKRHDLMMNSLFSLKSSTEQSSRNVIYLLAPAFHMLPASQIYDQYSCATLSLGSFAQARMRKTPFLYQLIYPYYWVNLYAIWHIFLVDKCQCARVQLHDVRHNETQSSVSAFNLWGKRSLRNFIVLNTPIFFFFLFKKTIVNIWVWGSGSVG